MRVDRVGLVAVLLATVCSASGEPRTAPQPDPADFESEMVVQIVRFESELPEDEVLAIARKRMEEFRALPGLVQKYYVRLGEPNHYGGIYVWDSMESFAAYRASDLAASIPRAYKVKGQPTIEILDGITQLREGP